MFPRSTTLGCFLLLIILLVTSFWEPHYVFVGDKEWYEKDGEKYVLSKLPRLEYICLLVSLPFLLLTFMIYSILPDLQNMHGYTLRAHVASLFVSNVIRLCFEYFPIFIIGNYCLSMAYMLNFSFFSSLFWLNVICFDIWWTLRQFRSYRINLKKQEKKMFIMYSICAWGIAFILNVVCAILDIPSISKHLNISPEICVKRTGFSLLGQSESPCRSSVSFAFKAKTFWEKEILDLSNHWAKMIEQKVKGMIYLYVPASVSVIINICFFIATTRRIWYHDKQTANQLRNSRSSHHNKNKLAIYMKLSVVLGISWIMDIILWTMSFTEPDDIFRIYFEMIFWHITQVIDILQGVILFLAFVWKKKIMLLLKKRFGCQVSDPINILRNNDHHCTSPNPTTPHTVEIVSMQEISPFESTN